MAGLNTFLKQKSGPINSELLLRPNDFGLGKLPRNLETNATTTSVCGFCSTGCQLKIHLKDDEATDLTPAPDYPVNLGMACPKGWEALAVLDFPDRATTPLLHGKEVTWQEAADTFATAFKKVQEQHGKESVAFISTGQMPANLELKIVTKLPSHQDVPRSPLWPTLPVQSMKAKFTCRCTSLR